MQEEFGKILCEDFTEVVAESPFLARIILQLAEIVAKCGY